MGWMGNATPWKLYPQEREQVPIVQEAGWAPGPIWTVVENLAHTGIRSTDLPARSESLYLPRYPGSQNIGETKECISKNGSKGVQ
jgi:hypothetical protein